MHGFEDLRAAEDSILAPVARPPGRREAGLVAGLAGAFLLALAAWGWQIANGLQVTGLNNPVFWGTYIVNFVFFIGVSHAGTLISAILRITQAQWRTPFTRMAEMITIASLPFAATCVIVDLGRPERMLNVILYPHFTSPILWDVACISTYVTLSCLYFYVALIPDLALCRDRLVRLPALLRTFYRLAALEWTDTERQRNLHNRIMTAMSVTLL
ncbi:MAG: NrfD/PsrC family molybdoenzyme membrane anchor subunit, partial [bacterium]